MKTKIPGLKPAALWKHFFALAAIPHCSKHEAQAAQYVLAQARRLGLPARQDAAGNVMVTKPASDPAKTGPAVVLQGHLDMVCEKNETTAHDFAKEGIHPVRDGDYIRAQGTTLGADNGIGVAAALAVMEAKDLVHGPMEFLFTIDEET
ncbi:MAG TPA: M20/M25/M40 family metallo-hydrolase, partial [Acidobacteriota bacterium]|nr:M20/M25/M40 family metallo-hydrolase [Acidobacteriota bacterium]